MEFYKSAKEKVEKTATERLVRTMPIELARCEFGYRNDHRVGQSLFGCVWHIVGAAAQ